MLIRYANDLDLDWLAGHDEHISREILLVKINFSEVYLAELENKPIGWLRYNLFWDNTPFMNMIYFLEEYRGRGFGKILVKYWEKEMAGKGYKMVLTSTLSNEEAQHFYRKLGYNEIGGFKLLDEPYEIIFHKNIQ